MHGNRDGARETSQEQRPANDFAVFVLDLVGKEQACPKTNHAARRCDQSKSGTVTLLAFDKSTFSSIQTDVTSGRPL
jgi:hypothetical protein